MSGMRSGGWRGLQTAGLNCELLDMDFNVWWTTYMEPPVQSPCTMTTYYQNWCNEPNLLQLARQVCVISWKESHPITGNFRPSPTYLCSWASGCMHYWDSCAGPSGRVDEMETESLQWSWWKRYRHNDGVDDSNDTWIPNVRISLAVLWFLFSPQSGHSWSHTIHF